jgi:RimJ/RimL family protein N-acetyltransferase
MIGDRSCWGMGFGQSAWNCLGDFLLCGLEIRKLTGGTLRGNLAMVSIMEKFGMTLEGIRREQEVVEGSLQDLVYYAKFNRSGA